MADEEFGEEYGDYYFDDDYLYVEDEYAVAVSGSPCPLVDGRA